MRLVNVSRGRLSSRGIVSNITILGNDDPYGVFEFEPTLLTVGEVNRNVTIRVARRRGAMGNTRVYYTSLKSNVSVDGVVYNRAEENLDFYPVSGFIDFLPNQTSGSFVLPIMDDVTPEANETIIVNMTSVTLIGSQSSGRLSKLYTRLTNLSALLREHCFLSMFLHVSQSGQTRRYIFVRIGSYIYIVKENKVKTILNSINRLRYVHLTKKLRSILWYIHL